MKAQTFVLEELKFSISIDEPGDQVMVDGLELPESFRFTQRLDGTATADVRLDYSSEAGRYRPTEVQLTAESVSAENLRDLAAKLDRLAVMAVAVLDVSVHWVPPTDAMATLDLDAHRKLLDRQKSRHRWITPELLAETAEVYAANPKRPTAAVAEHWKVSSAQASRYVRAARDADLIPERSS